MRRCNHTWSFAPGQGIVARLVFSALAVAMLLTCSPAVVSGDDEQARPVVWATELRPVTPPEGMDLLQRAMPATGILRHHVNSRLQSQFEDLASYRMPAPGMEPVDWAMHRTLNETAADRARRGTRRGVEDFLRANTPVGAFIERLDRMNPLNRLGNIDPLRRMGATGDPAGPRRDHGFDLGVGFNHLTPGLEMSRKVGKGSIRTMVDVLGWVEFEYVRGEQSRTRFHVVYDARYGEAVMGCRLEF